MSFVAAPSIPHSPKEAGQGLVEYALILVLVAVVVIVILSQVGSSVRLVFLSVTDALQNPQTVCVRDTYGTQEYYNLTPGNPVQHSPITHYSDSSCSTVQGSLSGWTIIRKSIPEADARTVCEGDGYAHFYDSGPVWTCSNS